MTDLDLTWQNPSKAQEVALKIAMSQKSRGMTEFQVAEFICLADKSLWFTQAKHWAKQPPKIGPSAAIWQKACELIVSIVESGYDAEAKTWWPLKRLGTAQQIAAAMLILMDFGMMLKQYRKQSLDVVSAGFEVFLDIVCGQNWQRKYKKFTQRIASAVKGESA